LSGEAKTPLGPDHVNVLLLLSLCHVIEFLIVKKQLEQRDRTKTRYRVIDQSSAENASFFDYHALSSLDPGSAGLMAAHEYVLTQRLQFQPWGSPGDPVTWEEFERSSWEEIREAVFLRGFASDARAAAWARLLGPKDLGKAAHEYAQLKSQLQMLTRRQRSAAIQPVQDILKVIDQDVRRNDRNTPEYRADDSPAAEALRHILTAYSLFNHNTGYVQGMTDLASPLVPLFVREWKDAETAVMWDGAVRTRHEAEAFVFVAYRSFMELTGQDRLFENISVNDPAVLEYAKAIALSVHPDLGVRLSAPDLKSIQFMFRPVLLLFKREFSQQDLLRLWDSFIAADAPWAYARFIAAALLILAFPKLLLHTSGTLGEAMTVMDATMLKTSVQPVLKLTNALIREVGSGRKNGEPKKGGLSKTVYAKLETRNDFKEYRSPYFPLAE
jgi:hypothetical protein